MITQKVPTSGARLDWRALNGSIAGEVLLPASPGFDAARRPFNPRFEALRPKAIVRCAAAEDVAEALAFLRYSGLPLAVRSGGHCCAGRSSTRGVLLDVGPMDSVTVEDGRAVVGAGTRLAGLYDGLAVHGMTIPAGCGPTVGIGGLTLGGGLGLLGRTYGLTADRLRAARVVLADGRIVDCDQHRHPGLFWALRGGGAAGLGVVTRFTFDPVTAPLMTRFTLRWPLRHAERAILAWQGWAPSAPDELDAGLHLVAPGRGDGPPRVVLTGAMLGTLADTSGQLEEFISRVGTDPAGTEVSEASHRQTKQALAAAGAGRLPGHEWVKSSFFAQPLTADIARALIRRPCRNPVRGLHRTLAFMPWAGAYNRVPPDATAFVHRGERFLLQHLAGVRPDAAPAAKASARRWVRRSYELARPPASPGVYPNFPDPQLDDPPAAYYGTNLPRLRRIKAAYDPGMVFGGAAMNRSRAR
jgi:FAD/FMN-containing dehydrogenase